MILDAQTRLSDAQDAGLFNAGTNASTNIYDFGSARDSGPGEMLEVFIKVDTTITGTSSTVTFQIETDTVSAFSSPTILCRSDAIAEAALVEDTEVFTVALPTKGMQRYVRINYVVGVADLTAGAVTAYVGILDRQANSL